MAVAVHLVVVEDPLSEGLVQHLPVPIPKPLGLGDLLVRRMAVEDVVVSFAGRAGPDVPLGIATEKRVSESGDLPTRPSHLPQGITRQVWDQMVEINTAGKPHSGYNCSDNRRGRHTQVSSRILGSR